MCNDRKILVEDEVTCECGRRVFIGRHGNKFDEIYPYEPWMQKYIGSEVPFSEWVKSAKNETH